MVLCNKDASYYKPVMWVFDLIHDAYDIDLIRDKNIIFSVGHALDSDITINHSFYADIFEKNIYTHEYHMPKEANIFTPAGNIDYISTIFYLVNCIQEYAQTKKDKYDRFKYESSLQFKYDILEKDYVKELIRGLLEQISPTLTLPRRKVKILISHDIDSLFGSLKYDGLWSLRNAKLKQTMSIITDIVSQKPAWFNISQIANLENEYKIKACYYWIVENGRSSDGIKNADYKFSSKNIQNEIAKITLSGNEIGLHKSTLSTSFTDEKTKLKIQNPSNRYHFLKIPIPQGWSDMQTHDIPNDSSLGYPSHMGFRNSFGMPFKPFDLHRKRTIDILEIPLNIMDGMFDITSKETADIAYERITSFIEKNKTDSIISILWHNSELTEYAYKWSFDCYTRLLQYIYDSGIECILPKDLTPK